MTGNIALLLEETARIWNDKPAVSSNGFAADWKTLDRRAGAVASELIEQGVRPGDRVAVSSPDPLTVVIALIGGLKAGAVVVPLSPRLSTEERNRILADLDPRLIVDRVPSAEKEYPACEVAGTDPAIILYTSGSTGAPKGVVLSHDATAFGLKSWIGPVMALRASDVVLAALPLAHSFGIFGAVLAPLLAGATVVLLQRFSVEDVLAAVARDRVTVFPGVATMFHRIVGSPALKDADVSGLRIAVSGAAPCPWELADRWRQATGVRIIRGYGMTELFRPISFSAADEREVPNSIGKNLPGVDIRIVDPQGAVLAVGETGELWIKSPARLSGYLGQADAIREVLDGEWFKTGDLATISSEGFVSIVGRKKDIILRGGYTVAAGEVEAALMTHPDVLEAAVIGEAHLEFGEEVVAFVVLRPGAQATRHDIIEFCKARLAGYKYPRTVYLRSELPRGPTGKVIKSLLQP